MELFTIVVVAYLLIIFFSREKVISSKKKSLLNDLEEACKKESEFYHLSEERKMLSLYKRSATLSEIFSFKKTLQKFDYKEEYISDFGKYVENANSLDENNVYKLLEELNNIVIFNIEHSDYIRAKKNKEVNLFLFKLIPMKNSIESVLTNKNADMSNLSSLYKQTSYLLAKHENINAFI